MNKQAYELGVQAALVDAGLVKQAGRMSALLEDIVLGRPGTEAIAARLTGIPGINARAIKEMAKDYGHLSSSGADNRGILAMNVSALRSLMQRSLLGPAGSLPRTPMGEDAGYFVRKVQEAARPPSGMSSSMQTRLENEFAQRHGYIE
jgi:hypothetical protein